MKQQITVQHSPELEEHLRSFSHDGANLAELLFEGGRLSYPGRRELEHHLGAAEPYTLDLEARLIHGLPSPVVRSARMLGAAVTDRLMYDELDGTLELLWMAHRSFVNTADGLSPDRLVAGLVGVQLLLDEDDLPTHLHEAADILVTGLYELGFPPSYEAMEELFDGAFPACVGLDLVDVP